MNKRKKKSQGLKELKQSKDSETIDIEIDNVNIIADTKMNQSSFKNSASLILNGFYRELNTSGDEIAYTENEKKLTLLKKYDIQVPLQYESTMMIGLLLQLNTLLLNLMMPVLNILLIAKKSNAANNYRKVKIHLFNFLKIIIISHIIIKQVDTSRLYHMIKLQSYMKIFALINFLQMIEKMTSTILVDITTEQKDKQNRDSARYIILKFLIQLPILFVNSLVIIMQALTFNVIINSKGNNKLNTLLITISFNKLKSSTFKKFNGSSLFQVFLQDSNDRFQLNVALIIVLIKNYFHFNKILILLMVTSITDWVQQTFIVRYNNIDIKVYSAYKEVLIHDYLKNGVIKRFGMPVDGHIISCVVLLYRKNMDYKRWGIFLMVFFAAKVMCLYLLEKLLQNYDNEKEHGIDKNVTRFIKELPRDNDVSVGTMSKVVRYQMNGKKIF